MIVDSNRYNDFMRYIYNLNSRTVGCPY